MSFVERLGGEESNGIESEVKTKTVSHPVVSMHSNGDVIMEVEEQIDLLQVRAGASGISAISK